MDARVPAGLEAAKGRRFGYTVGAALLVLGAVFAGLRHRPLVGGILAGVGGLLILGAAGAPAALVPVEREWMRAAAAISRVTTPVFMGAIYFLVITPVGVAMRLVGHRPLIAREELGSYWVTPPSKGRSDLTRQF